MGVAVLPGVTADWHAASALVAGCRAVRIGGVRLMCNGSDWIAAPGRDPADARPHLRAAPRRWAQAMGCMLLAAGAAIAAEGAR